MDGLTRERDDLRSRVARLEDRVTFLKEIVAGGGNGGATNVAAMASSPRAPSRSITRQVSGKRATVTSWDDHGGDELYDDDLGRRGEDEEYEEDY